MIKTSQKKFDLAVKLISLLQLMVCDNKLHDNSTTTWDPFTTMQ